MKFIICTGDSHTWGQGPAGLLEHFTDPEVQAGELRPSPFDVPFYVNLVRDEVNRRTGSSAYEEEPRTVIEGEYRTGRVCDAARFVFRFDGHNNYKVASVIDGMSRSPLIGARTDENGELNEDVLARAVEAITRSSTRASEAARRDGIWSSFTTAM